MRQLNGLNLILARSQQACVPFHYEDIIARMTMNRSDNKKINKGKSPQEPLIGKKVIAHLKRFKGEHKIAVGLSGGVDSSLTAALLVEAGWDVEGVTLWLMQGKGSCCTDGLVDAAAICDQLGISHHVLDKRTLFKKEIINHLVNTYKEGETPLPCSRCNRFVKFTPMINWAKEERNITRFATGHYARIKYAEDPSQNGTRNRHQLLRGIDHKKDQSYFLYDLSQEVLGQIVFPLGELTKPDTRKEAHRFGLRTANKSESQDLCLAEHYGSMKAFLDNYLPSRKGEIVLKDGSVLGEHDGIEHFTIGQRKGLGISWKEPLHVISLDSSLNRVVVAPRSDSGQNRCMVGQVNWISIEPPQEERIVEVQIRYRSEPVIAKLSPIGPLEIDIANNRPYRCLIEFEEEQFSITPGQAAVFYQDEVVLGGGIIEKL